MTHDNFEAESHVSFFTGVMLCQERHGAFMRWRCFTGVKTVVGDH